LQITREAQVLLDGLALTFSQAAQVTRRLHRDSDSM
jgi:hypothetical protein